MDNITQITDREITAQDIIEVINENEITEDSILYISSERDDRGAGIIEIFESDFNTFTNGDTTMVRYLGEWEDENFVADAYLVAQFLQNGC